MAKKLLPSLGRETKATPFGLLETKDAATRRASGSSTAYPYVGQPYVPAGPNVDRMVKDGYEKVIWAFRGIDAIADKMSSWPIECGEGDPDVPGDWKPVKNDPILPLLNHYSNIMERSAKYFRYRLVSQLLLSKKGVFVEVIVNRMGVPSALNLLPPGLTHVLPDPDEFIAGFRVDTPGADQPYFDLKQYDPEKRPGKGGVVWIRKPHPTDPYSSVTPLEAAGISLDLDFYARLYNRNFLLNDGRAGQIVAVKGGLSTEDALELKARFQPGMGGAGRTTVIEADTVNVSDTATTPRDAQYAELRKITKDDILDALGTDASIIGQVAGRTFDNADAAKENWLDVTVLPLSKVVDAGFDVLTAGGYDDDRRLRHDVTGETVLRRRWEAKIEKARADQAAGRISVDEWRELAELDPIGRPGSRVLWLATGKIAIGGDDGDEEEASKLKPVGGPPDGPVDDGTGGDLGGFDAQVDSFLGGGQPGGTSALSSAQAPASALEAASLFSVFGIESKAFNPKQPRYPTGHPMGGQFMDAGDTALWLAGKPLRNGTPAANVPDPNAGSTAAKAIVPSARGGAARLLQHPDPRVQAAAWTLTFPTSYPYARVLGAPPAQAMKTPRGTKLVSLRKGDVIRLQGSVWSVAGSKRGGTKAAPTIDLELVDAAGNTRSLSAGAQQTVIAEARTPHPTVVAQAKRDVAAAARALGAAPAGQAAPAAPAPAPLPTALIAANSHFVGPNGATLTTGMQNRVVTFAPAGGQTRPISWSQAASILNGGGWTPAPMPAAPAPAPTAPPVAAGIYHNPTTGSTLVVSAGGIGTLTNGPGATVGTVGLVRTLSQAQVQNAMGGGPVVTLFEFWHGKERLQY